MSRREFKNLKDVNQTTSELDNLRLLSIDDLLKLQDLLVIYVRRRQNRIRVDEEDTRRKLQNFAVRLDDQCRAFQRIVDAIHGREDWTRLSPKEPTPEGTTPPRKESGKNSPDFTSSNPKIIISAPPSPYQATVEDVEDDPSDETSMVESYHYVHPQETPPTAPGPPIQTPPVVLVRAPTDGLEEQTARTSKPEQTTDTKRPEDIKPKATNGRPHRENGWSDWRAEEDDEARDLRKPSKVVTQTQRDERPLVDIQAEIERLQAELNHLKIHGVPKDEAPSTPGGKRRAYHPSMDLGVTDEPLQPSPLRRKRSMTTPGAEKPTEYQTDSDSHKPRRTPKPSPRERPYDYAGPSTSQKVRDSPRQNYLRPNHSPKTPQSAVEMGSSPWFDNVAPIDEGYVSNQKTDRYGADPRRSAPNVGESSSRTYKQGPSFAGEKRTHRFSENFGARPVDVERAFNDWLNTQDGRMGDFDLFGPAPFDDQAAPGPSRRLRESSTRNSSGSRAEESRAPPVEQKLPVTLEELYNGAKRSFNIRRTVIDSATGRPKEEVKPLEVPIYRGLKPGAKIKFAGEGGVSPEGLRQDLHFIIEQRDHPMFTRQDRDLHAVVEIGLGESLLGWQRTITSICGKTVKVGHEGPTPPSWQEPFAGLGMCSYKNNEERGDLIVGVKIKYPGQLNERQKALIRAALMEK